MEYEYLIEQISSKWGALEHESSYLYNGSPEYLDGGHFNYVFKPVKMKSVDQYFDKQNYVFSESLRSFFDRCNGCKLALSAFSIYGFPLKKEKINTYDLLIQNLSIHVEMQNNGCDNPNLMFFGSFSGVYVFAYDMRDPEHYLCMKKGTSVVVKQFDSLLELFRFFIPRVFDEYNEDYTKTILNAEYADIPVLANSVLMLDDLI